MATSAYEKEPNNQKAAPSEALDSLKANAKNTIPNSL